MSQESTFNLWVYKNHTGIQSPSFAEPDICSEVRSEDRLRSMLGITQNNWFNLKCKKLLDATGCLDRLRFLSEETYTHREFKNYSSSHPEADESDPFGSDVKITVIDPEQSMYIVEAIGWLFLWCANNVRQVCRILDDIEENVLEGIYHAFTCDAPHLQAPKSHQGQGAQFMFCVLETVHEYLLYAHENNLIAEFRNSQPTHFGLWKQSTGNTDDSRYQNPHFQPIIEVIRPSLPAPADSLPIDVLSLMFNSTTESQSRAKIIKPYWADNDDLALLFDNEAHLLKRGKVVWAALIQAQPELFQPAYCFGGTGEVLYDPKGRMSFECLETFADALARRKGQEGLPEEEQFFADALAQEHIRLFDQDYPKSLCGYPLKVSSTYFDQLHLPDGMLSIFHIPILISHKTPGAVLPLPYQFWPLDFKEIWLKACERKHGQPFDVWKLRADALENAHSIDDGAVHDPDPFNVDPHSLYIEGLKYFYGRGPKQDYAMARLFWEKAARLGHGESMNNLGIIHSLGQGGKPDWRMAFNWYQKSAEIGCVLGILNLGKIHLRDDAPFFDLAKARTLLETAAAKGNMEAMELLKNPDLYGAAKKPSFLKRLFGKLG